MDDCRVKALGLGKDESVVAEGGTVEALIYPVGLKATAPTALAERRGAVLRSRGRIHARSMFLAIRNREMTAVRRGLGFAGETGELWEP